MNLWKKTWNRLNNTNFVKIWNLQKNCFKTVNCVNITTKHMWKFPGKKTTFLQICSLKSVTITFKSSDLVWRWILRISRSSISMFFFSAEASSFFSPSHLGFSTFGGFERLASSLETCSGSMVLWMSRILWFGMKQTQSEAETSSVGAFDVVVSKLKLNIPLFSYNSFAIM